MELFRRGKKGTLYVRFYHPVTRRRVWRSTKTTDRKTAELIGKSIELQAARQKFGIEPTDTQAYIPISRFARDYLKYSRTNKAANTAEIDRLALSSFQQIVGDKLVTEVKATDLEHFKTERLKTASVTSVNIWIRALRAAFKKAVEWGYINEDPGKGVAQIRQPKSPPKYLTGEEIEKLLTVDQQMRDRQFNRVIRFFLLTGLRRSELLNLEWSDVDPENGLIHIRNKETFQTKTLSERSIPISAALERLIQEIGPKEQGYVFPSPNGGTYEQRVWGRKLKRRVRRAGLSENYTLHTLRHTFATHLREKGAGLDALAELLGHTSLETTRMYGHLTPKHLRSVVSLLDW